MARRGRNTATTWTEDAPDDEEKIDICEAERKKCLTAKLKTQTCPKPKPSCKATVSEIDHCLEIQQDLMKQLSSYTCSEFLDENASPPDFDKAERDKCDEVSDLCLDDDEEDDGNVELDAGLPADSDSSDFIALHAELAQHIEDIRASAAEAFRKANDCGRAPASSKVLDTFAQSTIPDPAASGVVADLDWSPVYSPTSAEDAEALAVKYAETAALKRLGCDVSIGVGIDPSSEEPALRIVFGHCRDCDGMCTATCPQQ